MVMVMIMIMMVMVMMMMMMMTMMMMIFDGWLGGEEGRRSCWWLSKFAKRIRIAMKTIRSLMMTIQTK